MPNIHVCLIVEPHRLELDWRRALFESGRQIDIFGYDAPVEEADHTFVDVFF